MAWESLLEAWGAVDFSSKVDLASLVEGLTSRPTRWPTGCSRWRWRRMGVEVEVVEALSTKGVGMGMGKGTTKRRSMEVLLVG